MDIQKEVMSLIAKQLNLQLKDIKMSNAFITDLKADSLDVVELVMSLEEKFGISIPDEEAEKLETIQKMVDYIKKQKS